MSEKEKYVKDLEQIRVLQKENIRLLEKALKDYKSMYESERRRADTFRDLLKVGEGCPAQKRLKDPSLEELVRTYGII